ncbi:MAG TPA: glycoside hydrolase domain-containing protein [Acidobacteriaceae bacterium]|jgi:hypothetical protein|nr:glycoside hydrolase domain-containing protein [Acidobacteriaceae bacterium]
MPIFAGFDSGSYPGDATMNFLKANTNFVFCGYYLAPSPSQSHATWMGNRDFLAAAGWGFAPVYVGQQVIPPGSLNPSTTTGQVDGEQAAGYMASEGFAANSYVYLDLENGPPLTPAQHDYVTAWSAAVVDGGYKPGVYCSHLLAAQVAALRPDARIWTFRIPATPPPLSNPYPTPDPAHVFPGAHVLQHIQNCSIQASAGGPAILKADLNSAPLADPSSPDPA